MPHPENYTGTQDDDRTRSVDLVHIEPSIKEGTFLTSSMYGPDTSNPLIHTPPRNITPPVIVGERTIPNTLECLVGAWEGSPTPYYSFQWMADGNDIPFAHDKTWTSDPIYDGQQITCQVRGYSNQGEENVLTSNFIEIVLIIPLKVPDGILHRIHGMDVDYRETMWESRTMFTSGISVLKASTVMRSVAYNFSGRAAIGRFDINDMKFEMITGLPSRRSQVMGDIINIFSYDVPEPLVTGVPQNLRIVNPSAELGIAGWTSTGTATWRHYNNNSLGQPSYFFGGKDARGVAEFSTLEQDVPIPAVWLPDVIAGDAKFNIHWLQTNDSSRLDSGNIRVTFLDSVGGVISEHHGTGIWPSPIATWFPRESGELDVPTNATQIRLTMEFLLHATTGTDNNAAFERLRGDFYKGSLITSRDEGPNFSSWRIRTQLYNAWPGGAYAEVEMRNGIGGVDQCTGGTVIAGSSALGGDPSYAFDDIRNNGFWAGAVDGIDKNTAWIGYQFPSAWKPSELDITARDNEAAAQMPTSIMLEGTNDGLKWTKVQEFSRIPVPTHRKQQQFVVDSGPVDYFMGAGTGLNTGNAPTSRTGAVLGRMKARLNIEDARVWVAPNGAGVVLTPYIFSWYSDGGWVFIKKILSTGPSQTFNADSQWAEFALDTVVETEVGDLIGLGFANSGANFRWMRRNLSYFSQVSSNIFEPSNEMVYDDTVIAPGHRDSASGNTPLIADFKGTIF